MARNFEMGTECAGRNRAKTQEFNRRRMESMKNRYLMILPLAASMIVPAMAQQNSSSTNSQQPAATSTQNAPATQDQTSSSDASARQPLQPQLKQGFWGHLNPFARKKYLERQLSPIRNRVNELDELTANNSKMLKDVDARATEGIRQASAKADQADQHAVDAGNRAQQANQTATQAGARLETVSNVVGNLDQYKPATQAEINFKPGQTVLSAKAKEALDEIAQNLKDQKGYIVEVQGFAAGRGSAAISSSHAMADSVVRYLVLNHEIPVYRIFEVGMGNAPQQNAEGKTTKLRGGKVNVTLMKNGIDQLATAQPNAQPQQQQQMSQSPQ
jgi:outer membrane protein OmpA-like peptidoglycan-associated protein